MNAARWDASSDPWDMLGWCPGDCSVRQQGLWAIACIRRIWHHLPSECREFLSTVEQSFERTDYLVGVVDRTKWEAVIVRDSLAHANTHVFSALRSLLWVGFYKSVVGSVADAIASNETGFTGGADWPPAYRLVWRREQAVHARLLREVRGNPYRPVALLPSWRTCDVSLLAQNIYDTRDFSALPILADALQDAGCNSDELLNHLRDPNAPHVRGCWALDLVLGKS